jgi:sialate O-acetylesterase
MTHRLLRVMLALVALAPRVTATTALNMTRLFGDDMVLDFRDPAVHGRATPGATVSVAFNGAGARTTVAADGQWRVALAASACADMPRSATLTVTDGAGGSATATGVACGQVFVCTGQSSA